MAEVFKRDLLQLQGEAKQVINQGDAKAKAMALAEAAEIQGQSKVELAKMNAEALKILNSVEVSFDF